MSLKVLHLWLSLITGNLLMVFTLCLCSVHSVMFASLFIARLASLPFQWSLYYNVHGGLDVGRFLYVHRSFVVVQAYYLSFSSGKNHSSVYHWCFISSPLVKFTLTCSLAWLMGQKLSIPKEFGAVWLLFLWIALWKNRSNVLFMISSNHNYHTWYGIQ